MATTRRQVAAPTLLDCLESFTLSLRAANLAADTERHYTLVVRQVAAFLDNPSVAAVTRDDLRRFLVSLETMAPSSRVLRYTGLKVFFTWAQREGLRPDHALDGVPRPRAAERLPEGLSDDEMRKLLGVCNTRSLRGARDAALILTLYATGLRIAECLALDRADLIVDGKDRLIRVVGKGNRERLLVLGPTTREAIARYLLRRTDDDPALFLGQRGRLTRSGAEALFRRLGEQAGVAHVHPHRLRNTALSAMLAAGMDVLQVMKIAGHRDVTMLRHYVAYDEARRANAALLSAQHVERLHLTTRRRGRPRKGTQG